MILDATAGNRTMWNDKQVDQIIYIDQQKKLSTKPTIFADNTKTPFLPKQFDTIFYDPPHMYGQKWNLFIQPSEKKRMKKVQGMALPFTYYGAEVYNTRVALIHHIWDAQREFHRILKDDGLLWLKWNDVKIHIKRIITIFDRWIVLLWLYIKSPTQTYGKHQTYWICMCKKNEEFVQTRLL